MSKISKSYFFVASGFGYNFSDQFSGDLCIQVATESSIHEFVVAKDSFVEYQPQLFIRRGARSRFWTDYHTFEGICTGVVRRRDHAEDSLHDYLRIIIVDGAVAYVRIDADGDVQLRQEVLSGERLVYVDGSEGELTFRHIGIFPEDDDSDFANGVFVRTILSDEELKKVFEATDDFCVVEIPVDSLQFNVVSEFEVADPLLFKGWIRRRVRRRSLTGYLVPLLMFQVAAVPNTYVYVWIDNFHSNLVRVRQRSI